MTKNKLKFGRYDYASYAAFAMYAMCSLVIPLLIVGIGKSLGFPLDDGGKAAGGTLHAVRSIFMTISLLSCGIIAAKIGKRLTLGTSVFLFGAGILCCAFATQYWMLILCLIIAGTGEGICEGIATPFIQDLHPVEPERYVGIGHSFWSVGIAGAVLIVGGLTVAGTPWRMIIAAVGGLTILASLSLLWRENPAKKYPETREKTDFSSLVNKTKIILQEPRFWRCCAAMFFGAGAEFGLTFWSAAYIELNFQTSVFVAGLGTGTIAAGMFLGRTVSGYISKPSNLRYIVMSAALGTIPVTLLLAILKPGSMPVWIMFTMLYILLFLAGIGIGPYWPVTQVYGVLNMPHCDSTLLYIYFSAMGIPGAGVFSWLMGWCGDKFGLTGTILVVPCSLVIFAGLIYYECWHCKNKLSNPDTV